MKNIFTIFLIFSSLSIFSSASKARLREIRIGWQIPWATQGQLVQVMKHTDVLKRHGFKAKFIGRTYGPLLNELALSDEIDIVLTADQPAVALFSKDKGWVGIGKLMYNRTLTYVPPKSKISDVKGLKGKTIAIPIGAAAERVTIEALQRNGLTPKKDVKIVNLGIREQVPLVKGKDWGNIDALSGFDPLPAIFEAQGLIKPVDIGKVVSMVLMNESLIKQSPGIATDFMKVIVDSYDYYRQNRKTANNWFMKEAKLASANHKACDIAASIEPNVFAKKKSDIRVSFTEDDFKIIESASDFLAPKLKKNVQIRNYVSNKYVKMIK